MTLPPDLADPLNRPTFSAALPGAVREVADASLPLFPRVEARCATCESHQGYVFSDGPPERGGTRFCVNGAGLTFTPAA